MSTVARGRFVAAISFASLLAAVWSAPAYGGTTLGRLFFTEEQRGLLEYRWKMASAEGELARGQIAVQGMVWRSDGRSTLWVNGLPLYQRSASLRWQRDRRDPAQVELQLPGRPPLHARVGETAR